MKKRLALLICIVMIAGIFGGCTNGASDNTPTPTQNTPTQTPNQTENPKDNESIYTPVSIDNFNDVTNYETAPERVVVLSYNSAEIMSALGIADRIVGIQRGQNSIDDVLPEYRTGLVNSPIPDSINEGGLPTIENMLALEPDLIMLNSYYFNVPTFGKKEDYLTNGVNVYVTEGSYVMGCTVENTYNDIRNIGKIFNVEAKAEEIINKLSGEIEAVNAKVKGLEPVRVMSFDAENNGNSGIAGGKGLANNLISLAGGVNVFEDVEAQFSQVAWEEVIDRDPDVIIIHKYAPADDAEKKIEYLKSMPELSEVSAIKNDRFIVVTLFSIFPGTQNALAVDTIARELHPDAFK